MRRWQLLFLLVGLAGLAWMVSHVGFGTLRAELAGLGWALAGAAVIHALVLLADSIILVLCTAQPFSLRLLGRAFRAYLAGHAINLTTALAGGEATKFTVLADDVPREELAAALLMQNLLSFLVHCLVVVSVGISAPFLLDLEGPLESGLHALAALFLVLAVVVPLILRRGPWAWPFKLLRRLRVSPARVDAARSFVDRMAAELGRRTHTRRVWLAALFGVLSRCGNAAEIALLLHALGVDFHPVVPFLSLVNTMLVHWITFFVPWQAGTNEAAAYLLFDAIGIRPAVGVIAELARKSIRIGFLALGVGVLALHLRRRRKQA